MKTKPNRTVRVCVIQNGTPRYRGAGSMQHEEKHLYTLMLGDKRITSQYCKPSHIKGRFTTEIEGFQYTLEEIKEDN